MKVLFIFPQMLCFLNNSPRQQFHCITSTNLTNCILRWHTHSVCVVELAHFFFFFTSTVTRFTPIFSPICDHLWFSNNVWSMKHEGFVAGFQFGAESSALQPQLHELCTCLCRLLVRFPCALAVQWSACTYREEADKIPVIVALFRLCLFLSFWLPLSLTLLSLSLTLWSLSLFLKPLPHACHIVFFIQDCVSDWKSECWWVWVSWFYLWRHVSCWIIFCVNAMTSYYQPPD